MGESLNDGRIGIGEVVRIPRSTWRGRMLCRLGFHRWHRSVAVASVIPTGTALLIKRRTVAITCDRLGCTARRDEIYDRERPVSGDASRG